LHLAGDFFVEDLVMQELVERVARQLTARHRMLATAESCTGGLIAAECTDLSGSSVWFDRGFVTYSNEAKSHMLGVSPELIQLYGAVSEPVALAMALGAVYRSKATAAVAVTGIAGPTGGSPGKPVGTVWIAWCLDGQTSAELKHFVGDRQSIRRQTVEAALQGLLERLSV
jgi:nicotinamide-nucleotide amidase